jgi:hypothetical protein
MSIHSDSIFEQVKRDQQERLLNQYTEWFFRKWAPEDPEQNSEFHADFHTLLRTMHRDAMEPVTKLMTDILSAMPVVNPSVFLKTPK